MSSIEISLKDAEVLEKKDQINRCAGKDFGRVFAR